MLKLQICSVVFGKRTSTFRSLSSLNVSHYFLCRKNKDFFSCPLLKFPIRSITRAIARNLQLSFSIRRWSQRAIKFHHPIHRSVFPPVCKGSSLLETELVCPSIVQQERASLSRNWSSAACRSKVKWNGIDKHQILKPPYSRHWARDVYVCVSFVLKVQAADSCKTLTQHLISVPRDLYIRLTTTWNV